MKMQDAEYGGLGSVRNDAKWKEGLWAHLLP